MSTFWFSWKMTMILTRCQNIRRIKILSRYFLSIMGQSYAKYLQSKASILQDLPTETQYNQLKQFLCIVSMAPVSETFSQNYGDRNIVLDHVRDLLGHEIFDHVLNNIDDVGNTEPISRSSHEHLETALERKWEDLWPKLPSPRSGAESGAKTKRNTVKQRKIILTRKWSVSNHSDLRVTLKKRWIIKKNKSNNKPFLEWQFSIVSWCNRW